MHAYGLHTNIFLKLSYYPSYKYLFKIEYYVDPTTGTIVYDSQIQMKSASQIHSTNPTVVFSKTPPTTLSPSLSNNLKL